MFLNYNTGHKRRRNRSTGNDTNHSCRTVRAHFVDLQSLIKGMREHSPVKEKKLTEPTRSADASALVCPISFINLELNIARGLSIFFPSSIAINYVPVLLRTSQLETCQRMQRSTGLCVRLFELILQRLNLAHYLTFLSQYICLI